jgi:hypothetical protein
MQLYRVFLACQVLPRDSSPGAAWLNAATARILLPAQLRLLALRLEAGLPLDWRSVANLVRLASSTSEEDHQHLEVVP